ncbi:MAG: hypothetical protein ABSF98_01150 [Bryobacteraceae bacterium]
MYQQETVDQMNVPVVGDALRRMEKDDGIRRRVQNGLESIRRGHFTEYEGRAGLTKLADEVRTRGRRLLAAQGENAAAATCPSRPSHPPTL